MKEKIIPPVDITFDDAVGMLVKDRKKKPGNTTNKPKEDRPARRTSATPSRRRK